MPLCSLEKIISIGTCVIQFGYVACRSTADSATKDALPENFVTTNIVALSVVSLCCVIAIVSLLLSCGICDISNGEVSGELSGPNVQKTKPAIYYSSTPSYDTSCDISPNKAMPYNLDPKTCDNLSSSQRSHAQVAVNTNHMDNASDFEGTIHSHTDNM
ncbi:uncharacterized protein LOC134709084 [Mytilus trossulus]|uniref:uncharacterized protein LOC134709084 n=1 Tax=Mytilus trossulus TaxID=6551 RepID=UPI0030064CA2